MLLIGAWTWHEHSVYNSYRRGLAQGIRETTVMYEKSIQEDKVLADTASASLLEEHKQSYQRWVDEKAILDKRLGSALHELRNRPTRADQAKQPSVCNQDSGTQEAVTGASLSREDAEFLAGEAAIGALIQNERDYYYGELKGVYEATSGIANRLNGTAPNAEPVSGTRLSP